MIKLLVKVVVAALIANATWRIGSAYVTFYRFKDAAAEYAQFNPQRSAPELQQHVIDLASQYDIPLADDAVSVRREGNHTYVRSSYTQQVDVVPGYHYPWKFAWEIDALTIPGASPAPNPR